MKEIIVKIVREDDMTEIRIRDALRGICDISDMKVTERNKPGGKEKRIKEADSGIRYYRVVECLGAGYDSQDGLYLCRAHNELEVKKAWCKKYNLAVELDEKYLEVASRCSYDTDSGNIFVLDDVKEIDKFTFDMLLGFVPVLEHN